MRRLSDDANDDEETGILLEAGAKLIGIQQTEIETLKGELERVTRARNIACFNVADLNRQREVLTDLLQSSLQLLEYMLSDLRNAGVVPSVACTIAKRQFDERMRKLFKLDGTSSPSQP